MGQTPPKSETRNRSTPSHPQTPHTNKQEAEQLDPTQEVFFFVFFLKSILAYGLDHGESRWFRKAT